MSVLTAVPRIPEIHGHRGCRGLRPENTVPAFLHALTLGVDVLEMDVVISADNQVVVSHEPWLNPAICFGPRGQVIDETLFPAFNLYQMLYAEIRHCDCGRQRHPLFPLQASVPAVKPLLREVLTTMEAVCLQTGRSKVGYSIEIKSTPDGDHIYHPAPEAFFQLVLQEVVKAGVLSRTSLLCFDPRILRLAHAQVPGLATCLLVENDESWPVSMHELGFVPTTLGPNCSTVTSDSVHELRTKFSSLRLVPWTVNEPNEMLRLYRLGVDGMTTDFPDLLRATLPAQSGFGSRYKA